MPTTCLIVALGMLGTPDGPAAGTEAVAARYEVDLIGRSRAVFALPAGPRTIRSVRWDPAPGSSDRWRSARLRLVWDGDEPRDAGVDLPLGLFVEPVEDEARTALVNRRSMPYRRSGRLVIDADGPVRGSIVLETVAGAPGLADRGYLRARPRSEDAEGAPESPSSSGESPENSADRPPHPVRYWYDRRPGPSAPSGPG